MYSPSLEYIRDALFGDPRAPIVDAAVSRTDHVTEVPVTDADLQNVPAPPSFHHALDLVRRMQSALPMQRAFDRASSPR